MATLRPSAFNRPQTQPKTSRLTVKALLSLPHRLCNPPPAVAKVRSCAITPVFKVQLEDVLNRKHLPPLGLKDFEEWLLYVEHCPENLYFILWLKEYTAKYNQWVRPHRSSTSNSSTSRADWPIAPVSSSLALFYTRAKQTFFTPNRSSPYELNIPSDILSPFHTSNFGSPHPDPAVFAEVAIEVHKMLKESLDRMVVAAYTNVGTNRGLCGIIGGFAIMLLGSIAPLLVNFLNGREKWLRLLAIPGMWLGLTIVLASLHGVCMMVYIFGDLRQLRKFELSRPPISRPQAFTGRHAGDPTSVPVPTPVVQPPILQSAHKTLQQQPLRVMIPTFPCPAVTHEPSRRGRSNSASSSSSSSISECSIASSLSSSSSSGSEGQNDPAALTIEISPAFYDSAQIEGPATGCPTSPTSTSRYYAYAYGSNYSLDSQDRSEFTPTASFILPYDPLYDDSDNDDKGAGGRGKPTSPEEKQGLGPFDFDSLPKRGYKFPERTRAVSVMTSGTLEPPSPTTEKQGRVISNLRRPTDILARVQHKCTATHTHSAYNPDLFVPLEKPASSCSSSSAPGSRLPVDPAAQFKLMRSVPAFSSPFTRVLNPLVTRAQWEIVVRSAALAGVFCWVFVGCLLAIPVHDR